MAWWKNKNKMVEWENAGKIRCEMKKSKVKENFTCPDGVKISAYFNGLAQDSGNSIVNAMK